MSTAAQVGSEKFAVQVEAHSEKDGRPMRQTYTVSGMVHLMEPRITRRTVANIQQNQLQVEHVEDTGTGAIFKRMVAQRVDPVVGNVLLTAVPAKPPRSVPQVKSQ